MTDLAGRRALVTGASGGLGRAIATALSGAGVHVLLHGRDTDRLQALSLAIGDAGGSCEHVAADLRDEQAAAAIFRARTGADPGQ